MDVKKNFQLTLIIILIIFIGYFVKNTFLTDTQEVLDLDIEENKTADIENKNQDENIINAQNITNTIKNLSYKSFDVNGNEYFLEAETGEVVIDSENEILLNNVVGIINLKNKAQVRIKSDYAIYNSKNFDTFFYDNVYGSFKQSEVYSDNLDLLFKDNLAIMYNNIKFLDDSVKASADKVSLNLISGDIKIDMFKKEEKIKIIKN
tara:strand:- start:2581 stop:3198 length:618 start_codon:yes stop_codon:yes gene_type:complete